MSAPGHNPDALTVAQVGKGWRLLSREEVDHRDRLNCSGENLSAEIQRRVKSRWRKEPCMGSDYKFAYRTKRPAGYFLPTPFVAGTGALGATEPGQVVTAHNIGNLPAGSVVKGTDGSRLIRLHDDLWLWICDGAWCYHSAEALLPRLTNPTVCHLPANTGVLRTAVADYMQSEGCSCCQDEASHRVHEATLAKLLDVPAYPDSSGYDFNRFCTKPTKIA